MMKRLAIIVAWVCALALAALLDRPMAAWVFRSGIAAKVKSSHLDEVLKIPGHFGFTLVLATALAAMYRWRWSMLVLVAGVISGVNEIIKWIIELPPVCSSFEFRRVSGRRKRPYVLRSWRRGCHASLPTRGEPSTG